MLINVSKISFSFSLDKARKFFKGGGGKLFGNVVIQFAIGLAGGRICFFMISQKKAKARISQRQFPETQEEAESILVSRSQWGRSVRLHRVDPKLCLRNVFPSSRV